MPEMGDFGKVETDAAIAVHAAIATAHHTATTRLASKAKSETRDLATGSGDVAYTGYGFKPSMLIALAAIADADVASWGFADSVKAGMCIDKGYYTVKFSSNNFLVFYAVDSSRYQYAIVASYDADGFTLTWSKTGTPTGTLVMKILALR